MYQNKRPFSKWRMKAELSDGFPRSCYATCEEYFENSKLLYRSTVSFDQAQYFEIHIYRINPTQRTAMGVRKLAHGSNISFRLKFLIIEMQTNSRVSNNVLHS